MKARRGSALLAVLLIVLAAALLGLSLALALRDREEAVIRGAEERGERDAEDSIDEIVTRLQDRLAADPARRAIGPEVIALAPRTLQSPRPITAADLKGRPGRYTRVVARAWPANAFIDINTDPQVLRPVFESLLKIGLKDESGAGYVGATAAAVTSFAFARLQELRPEGGLFRSPEEAVRRLRFGIASDLRARASQSAADDLLVQSLNGASDAVAFRRELGRLDKVLARLVSRGVRAADRRVPPGARKDARGWSFSVPLHRGFARFRGDFEDPSAAPTAPESFGPILSARAAIIGSATLALPQASRRPVSPIAVNEAPLEVLAAVFAVGLRYAETTATDAEEAAIAIAVQVEALRRASRFRDFADFESRVSALGLAGVNDAFFAAFDFENRLAVAERDQWGGILNAALIAGVSPTGAPLPPPLSFQGDGLVVLEVEAAVISLAPQRLGPGGQPLVIDALDNGSGSATPAPTLEERLLNEGEVVSLQLFTGLVQAYESRRLGSALGWAEFARRSLAPEDASWPQDMESFALAAETAPVDTALAVAGLMDGGLVSFAPRPAARFFASLRAGNPDLAGVAEVSSNTVIDGAFTDVLGAALPLAGSPLPTGFFQPPPPPARQTAEGLIFRLITGAAPNSGERLRWDPGTSGAFEDLDRGGLAFWLYLDAAPSRTRLAELELPVSAGTLQVRIDLAPGVGGEASLIVEQQRGLVGSGSSTRWTLDGASAIQDLAVDAWHLIFVSWSDTGPPTIQVDGVLRGPFTEASAPDIIPAGAALQLGLVALDPAADNRFILLRDVALLDDTNAPSFARGPTVAEASFGAVIPTGSRLLTARVIGADIGAADIVVDLGFDSGGLPLRVNAASRPDPEAPTPSPTATTADTRLRARVSFTQELGPVPERPRRLRSITAYVAPPAPTVFAWRHRRPARPNPRNDAPDIPESFELDALRGEQ